MSKVKLLGWLAALACALAGAYLFGHVRGWQAGVTYAGRVAQGGRAVEVDSDIRFRTLALDALDGERVEECLD